MLAKHLADYDIDWKAITNHKKANQLISISMNGLLTR